MALTTCSSCAAIRVHASHVLGLDALLVYALSITLPFPVSLSLLTVCVYR